MSFAKILKGNDCHEPKGSPKGGQFCSWKFSRVMRNSGSDRVWTVQVDEKTGKERYISYISGREVIRYHRPKN